MYSLINIQEENISGLKKKQMVTLLGRKSAYCNYMDTLKTTRLTWTLAKNMILRILTVSLVTDLQAYFITKVLERVDQINVYFPPNALI